MRNSWKKVYDNDAKISTHVFELLIKLNGHNISASFSTKEWLAYIKKIYRLLEIRKVDSVFEFGCGSGAFLYPHFIRGGKIGGVDFSPNLINIAKSLIDHKSFLVSTKLQFANKPKFDYVISHSVFQYLKNHSIAREVIKNMILKSKKTLQY